MNPLPVGVLQEIETSAIETIAYDHELKESDAVKQFEAWQLRKIAEPQLMDIRNLISQGNMRKALILLNGILAEIEEPQCQKLTDFISD